VIVLEIQVRYRVAAQPEGNPPVAGDRHAILTATIAFHRVQLPTWHRGHLRKLGRELERSQDRLDLPDRRGG
jgi:hypothetical protein